MTIFTLLTIATGLGLYLVTLTDLLVLLVGVVCFVIGILYTFGTIPISRMPLGELFSGPTMGFGILFLAVYVNAYDQGIANLTLDNSLIVFRADLSLLLEILLFSLPCVFTISNIMLANNICDLEDDIKITAIPCRTISANEMPSDYLISCTSDVLQPLSWQSF